MKQWLRQIKWAYQRVRYGYDETIKWEFDSYFSQFIQPLREFCEAELDPEDEVNNPKRQEIYKTTLKLIEDYRNMDYKDGYSEENAETKLWKYFGEHIGYYWN